MVNVIIDGKKLQVSENTTILEAANKLGIRIPTLCFLKEVNEISACRICVVEVAYEHRLVPACSTKVTDGMEIYTNSPRAREARRINLELILATHDNECNTCPRNGNCELQRVCEELGVKQTEFVKKVSSHKTNKNFPLIRENNKCIGCLRCVNFCDKIQSLGIWDLVGTGKSAKVSTASGRKIEEDNCSLCGQCITHCPVGALHERDDVLTVLDAIQNKDVITVAQIAPAVRSAFGEGLGIEEEKRTVGRMVAAAKAVGFDYVFDTNFSADLTIMEEATELLERVKTGGTMPMFTSCCPAWVRFIKTEYPEFIDNLSTAKSPQQMFGAVAKTYYAKVLGVDPSKIYSVSIMPCVAKKAEKDLPGMGDEERGQDVDAVITTREFEKLTKLTYVDVERLEEKEFDTPLGIGSGAGVIFGTTGGVMEAALRTAYYSITGKNPDADFIKDYRIDNGIKEFTVDINGVKLNIAVASGLANAKTVMENVKAGFKKYDFIEIMACPGGCAGGGGQPIHEGKELGAYRSQKLYELDKKDTLRFSHDNPAIKTVYKEFFEKPNSHKAHELLHVDHKQK
ncbi:MAG: 4Fe-4S dicluster domain-containing protein [Clostridiales bacterium]|nr:4Fe-4S dicluster domain-containing protein [Clostridiales bacterium]